MTKPIIIIRAWSQVLRGVTTDEHRRRAQICHGCTLKTYKWFADFPNDELIEVKGYVCTVCDCPLVAKIRSPEICKKWKAPTK